MDFIDNKLVGKMVLFNYADIVCGGRVVYLHASKWPAFEHGMPRGDNLNPGDIIEYEEGHRPVFIYPVMHVGIVTPDGSIVERTAPSCRVVRSSWLNFRENPLIDPPF